MFTDVICLLRPKVRKYLHIKLTTSKWCYLMDYLSAWTSPIGSGNRWKMKKLQLHRFLKTCLNPIFWIMFKYYFYLFTTNILINVMHWPIVKLWWFQIFFLFVSFKKVCWVRKTILKDSLSLISLKFYLRLVPPKPEAVLVPELASLVLELW